MIEIPLWLAIVLGVVALILLVGTIFAIWLLTVLGNGLAKLFWR